MRWSDLVYRLRHPGTSDEAKASLALFLAAAAALGLAFMTDRADLTTAILILCGFACFIAGLFLLTFHQAGMVAPDVASRLDPDVRIGLGRVAAELGLDGDAAILPGREPVQFVTSGLSYIPDHSAELSGIGTGEMQTSLVVRDGIIGLALPPFSLSLWRHLREKYGLVTPDGVDAALSACREAVAGSLELADRLETVSEGDDVIIEIAGFRLYDGCRIVHDESPKICTMFPCAVCGLFGVILADATASGWVYERVSLLPETRSVFITLRRHTAGQG